MHLAPSQPTTPPTWFGRCRDVLVQPDVFVLPLDEARTLTWNRMRTLLLVADKDARDSRGGPVECAGGSRGRFRLAGGGGDTLSGRHRARHACPGLPPEAEWCGVP